MRDTRRADSARELLPLPHQYRRGHQGIDGDQAAVASDLAELEHALFGTPLPDRMALIRQMREYTERHLAEGGKLNHISRHLLGLFQGLPGARGWRRHLSENAHRDNADWGVVERSLAPIREPVRVPAA